MVFNLICITLIVNLIASLIFLIIKGAQAKKHGTKIPVEFKAWFIVSIALIASFALLLLALYLLIEAFMASM